MRVDLNRGKRRRAAGGDERRGTYEPDVVSAREILSSLLSQSVTSKDLTDIFRNIDDGKFVSLDSMQDSSFRKGLEDFFRAMKLRLAKVPNGGLRAWGGLGANLSQRFCDLLSRGKEPAIKKDVVAKKYERTASSEINSPGLQQDVPISEIGKRKRMLGPSRPPKDFCSQRVAAGMDDSERSSPSSSSEDEFGPVPLSSKRVRRADPVAVEYLRQKESLRNTKEGGADGKLQREPWMLHPPTAAECAHKESFGAIFRKGGKSRFLQGPKKGAS